MRRTLAFVTAASLARSAFADPEPAPPPVPATAPAPAATPWIDSAPASVLQPIAAQPSDDYHPTAAALTLGGIYAGFIGWTYLAWYRSTSRWRSSSGAATAGSAARRTPAAPTSSATRGRRCALARAGTEMLNQLGRLRSHRRASIVSTALVRVAVPRRRGQGRLLSTSSRSAISTGDTAGALPRSLLDNWPRLDELFDYRVQYWPSTEYRHEVTAASRRRRRQAQHRRGLQRRDLPARVPPRRDPRAARHDVRDAGRGSSMSRSASTRAATSRRRTGRDGAAADNEHHQNLFLGVSLNAQGFFDWLLEGRPSTSTLAQADARDRSRCSTCRSPAGPIPGLEWTRTRHASRRATEPDVSSRDGG